MTDDDLAGESMYNDLLPEVVERLRTAGLLQVSDGAEVVFHPDTQTERVSRCRDRQEPVAAQYGTVIWRACSPASNGSRQH